MKLPYNHLHICGDVIFAARGGRIHSFSLEDGTHLSEWQHPDLAKAAALAAEAASAEKEAETKPEPEPETLAPPLVTEQAGGDDDDEPQHDDVDAAEPPAKRQRREDPDKVQDTPTAQPKDVGVNVGVDVPMTETADTAEPTAPPQQRPATKKSKKQKKKEKDDKRPKREAIASVPDRPVVIHMASTADGAHLLAVSGHDKTVWVFAHDGKGGLTQLSSRMMPKRPSSVLICPDDETVLVADKFGDVYSLPLIPSPSSVTTTAPTTLPSSAARAKNKFPAATALTVHSKANLRSLENQLRALEASSKKKSESSSSDAAAADDDKGTQQSRPTFDHTLQLGHVSMLTALSLARDAQGRKYIITADRDEHVRVSRFMPQAHVIESYCLGHEHFVSALAIAPARPEVLVSGGGDPELFVWDWLAGRLLAKVDVLAQVRAAVGEGVVVGQVAVVALLAVTLPGSEGQGPSSHILAIFEDIPYIFNWKLVETTLQPVESIRLPGNPLHITQSRTNRVFVSVDAGETSGAQDTAPTTRLVAFDWQDNNNNNNNLAVDPAFALQDAALDSDEQDVSASEVRPLFYNTAILRKHTGGEGEGEGQAQGGQDAPAEAGEDGGH